MTDPILGSAGLGGGGGSFDFSYPSGHLLLATGGGGGGSNASSYSSGGNGTGGGGMVLDQHLGWIETPGGGVGGFNGSEGGGGLGTNDTFIVGGQPIMLLRSARLAVKGLVETAVTVDYLVANPTGVGLPVAAAAEASTLPVLLFWRCKRVGWRAARQWRWRWIFWWRWRCRNSWSNSICFIQGWWRWWNFRLYDHPRPK